MDAFEQHASGSLDATEIHRLLLETVDLNEFLTELAKKAAAALGLHCGITTRGAGGPYTVASSDWTSLQLDELQYADGGGPCLQAMDTGNPVYVTDMTQEGRWGHYPGQAAAIGVRSSLSYPLVSREATIGALNLYSRNRVDPKSELEPGVQQIADLAGGALELALRQSHQTAVIGNLQNALTSRSTIDQAIGVLMAQQRCDARTAFTLLRTASQGRNIKLRDIAAQIVNNSEAGVDRRRGEDQRREPDPV